MRESFDASGLSPADTQELAAYREWFRGIRTPDESRPVWFLDHTSELPTIQPPPTGRERGEYAGRHRTDGPSPLTRFLGWLRSAAQPIPWEDPDA